MRKYRTLIIGSLFTLAERDFNVALAAALAKQSNNRLVVTLPQIEAEKFKKGDQYDLEAIRLDCEKNAFEYEIVIAILEGADCDSGTCYELGYRAGHGGGLTIGVRTDFRQSENGSRVNAMLTGVEMVYLPSPVATVPELANMILLAIERHKKL